MRIARVLFLALASVPAVAADYDTSIDLLKNMQKAATALSYRGTFIYAHGGKVESIQIFHRSDAKGERERVVHLNGTPREVIREKNVITCILPDSKTVTVSRFETPQHILTTLPSNFGDFRQFYDFSVAGQDRIAGRPAIIVRVEPKDNYRYGYRFWVDAQNSLMLKSEMVSDRGAMVEQVMFTQLEVVDDIPDAQLRPGMRGEHLTTTAENADKVAETSPAIAVQVMRAPDGFKPTGHQRQHLGEGVPVHHVVLSDGLASVSVYVEKRDPSKKQFIGLSFMGAVNVYGAVLNDYQVTAVGEVPAATVKMVAESIQVQ